MLKESNPPFKTRKIIALYEILEGEGGSTTGLDSPLLRDNPVV